MKTIERIFKHLNEEKVELKSERVELGVDDYLSYQRNLLRIREQIEQEVKKYASMKKQLLEIKRATSRLSVQSSKILQDAEAQAKKDLKIARDLGADPSIIYKPFQQVKNDVGANEQIAEKLIQRLGNIR